MDEYFGKFDAGSSSDFSTYCGSPSPAPSSSKPHDPSEEPFNESFESSSAPSCPRNEATKSGIFANASHKKSPKSKSKNRKNNGNFTPRPNTFDGCSITPSTAPDANPP
ncbi:hypothetical protein GCM10027290_15620 [Micromonospora sonneratiae]